jgi:hypothetical protein
MTTPVEPVEPDPVYGPQLDRYRQRIDRENREYEAAYQAWLVACAPGTKVFRANCYDGCGRDIDIREGVIVRTEEGIISDHGGFYEHLGGKHRKVVAKFAKDLEGRYGDDWYGQTCEGHEFHLTRQGALKKLVAYLNDQAEDKEREAAKLRARAAKLAKDP